MSLQETSLLLEKLSTELNQVNLTNNFKKHLKNGYIYYYQNTVDAIMKTKILFFSLKSVA